MNDFTVHVKPLIADVPGWLTDEEGEALYDLARACTGKGVIVEIDGKPAPFPPGDPPPPSDLLSEQLDRFERDRIYEEAVRSAAR